MKFREYLTESNYKEIEFVCRNSAIKPSTDKQSQRALYDDLKKLQKESKFKILPYMQDFSDDDHEELSLAVIILDKEKENEWERQIKKLADKHNVKIDLYNNVSNSKVDDIVKGDYNNLVKEIGI